MQYNNFRRWDVLLLIFILLLINLPLFYGGNTDKWAFYPTLVWQGQWWLLFTSQFAHRTWYHLLLDIFPFFLIYCTLEERRPKMGLLYVFFAGLGSILAASLFSKDIAKYGLRGFSGVTYGIMVLSASEMIFKKDNDKTRKIIGTSILILLLALIAYELFTGKFPFEFLLFNMLGKPILVCHAGGVVGTFLLFFILRTNRFKRYHTEVSGSV